MRLPTTEFFCDPEAIACRDSVLHRFLESGSPLKVWVNPLLLLPIPYVKSGQFI
ncbi:MAG: hypothetical protein ACRC8Y_04620 [Chroococcales cyanobacterium]